MRNGSSRSPFRLRLSRQPVLPRPPCVVAASPHHCQLGASYAALPQMAGRHFECACLCSPPARDLSTPPGVKKPEVRKHRRCAHYESIAYSQTFQTVGWHHCLPGGNSLPAIILLPVRRGIASPACLIGLKPEVRFLSQSRDGELKPRLRYPGVERLFAARRFKMLPTADLRVAAARLQS
jgi:hypothetical protein